MTKVVIRTYFKAEYWRVETLFENTNKGCIVYCPAKQDKLFWFGFCIHSLRIGEGL